jgi:2,3-dimethylmalate lyase
MVKKTSLLKQLILDKEILIMPGAFDALSAKIVEQAGFKCTTLGGYPTSAVRLAKPDVSLLTMTEMVEHTRYMANAVDIPLLVDGDTGHGNVTNVIRTVKEFERAGAAGLFLEDQVFPKRCGHMEGKQVITTDEMIAKLKAAVDTRSDQDFIIMARTDALAVYGIDEAIERGNRFREAGADLIFIEAPPTIEDMKRMTGEVHAPMSANMIEGGKTPLMSAKELEEIGYAVATFPLSALYAMAWAVRWVMGELATHGTTKGCFERMTLFSDFNRLVDLQAVRDVEAQYYKDLLGK